MSCDPDDPFGTYVIRMVGESAEVVGAGVGGGSSGNKMPTLEEYGTNLTKLAEERIQYSKSKSDCIAKAEGTYDKKKKQEEKCEITLSSLLILFLPLYNMIIVGHTSDIFLGRCTKNNPCLIGEPGVRKTAIAYGLAQRIANGDFP
ncbi:Chaperone protein ClpC1 [Forsythia ovata]|uniref:Chaperone protein ClpC1 n=1 Tax=Forsythia ovata TaxID=205694 RepID=A0ABD1WSL7_9LAMI